MKSLIAASVLLAMVGSQTLAAETAVTSAPAGILAAGKPAGVQEAQRRHRFPLLLTVGIAAVVIAGVVVAVESSNNSSCGSACGTTGTGGAG